MTINDEMHDSANQRRILATLAAVIKGGARMKMGDALLAKGDVEAALLN